MGLADLTRTAVERAIAEYDESGSERFLAKYGFGKARKFFLVLGGKQYHSKAIAGAAHAYLGTGSQPLRAEDFSGGEATVVHTLQGLGFEISTAGDNARNPNWIRDELILALDLYVRNPVSPPGKTSEAIRTLSAQLDQLARLLGRTGHSDFRNPNGVYMKVMNFRRFDPQFTSVGKSGLSHGSLEDERVWNEFAHRPGDLGEIAAAIRSALANSGDKPSDMEVDDDGIEEAEEGRLLTRLHQRRERNPKLVRARKQLALKTTGNLQCEVCDLSFAERYGAHGDGFIEVHHTRPLHTLREGEMTRVADLALLCANCHRMVHRRKNWLSISELKLLLLP